MKFAMILMASAVILTSSFALAQNSAGSTTPSGDSAVSPAAGNPANGGSNGPDRPNLGAGINSGAMNNGTTGDTIGTGPGTPRAPATGPATTTTAPGGRRDCPRRGAKPPGMPREADPAIPAMAIFGMARKPR